MQKNLTISPKSTMTAGVFDISATCGSTKARAGTLQLPHAEVQTPQFILEQESGITYPCVLNGC